MQTVFIKTEGVQMLGLWGPPNPGGKGENFQGNPKEEQEEQGRAR